jgi:hypothetical protein
MKQIPLHDTEKTVRIDIGRIYKRKKQFSTLQRRNRWRRPLLTLTRR